MSHWKVGTRIQLVFIQSQSREFYSKYFCQSELAELSEAIHQIVSEEEAISTSLLRPLNFNEESLAYHLNLAQKRFIMRDKK